MSIARLSLVAAALLLASRALAQEPPATNYAPRIACAESSWSFGDQVNTQTIEHVFTLKNEGHATLLIGNVRPTCGCTVAQLSTSSLEPGAEATLAVKLDLRGRSGAQYKQIRVESNDPTQPTYTLTMTGAAIAEVQVNPPNLFLGRLRAEGSATATVEIVTAPSTPLRVTGIASDNAVIGATAETVEEGHRYRLVVRTQPPLPVGHFLGRITVATDHPGAYSNLVVTVTGVVGGGLTVAPTEIVIGSTDAQPLTRHIVLHSPDNVPFSLLGVEVPAGGITATVFPMGGSGYRVQLDNLSSKPELNGAEIRIRTSVEEMPMATIPIRITTPSP
ncbi:MAG TPA: DUF1573 domain-containing protein [Kiritimatiellia bacterium]|nr:DUF1573 domain-containing protein [Kiritimatiellia bacterium]HRZ12537.1 DUF1573 domain-containing protein [Kiritimatiellia bacterium]HSA17615.1 DUF1573 domain-containing protein [Kiritimatiellia bacterium]